MNKLEIDSLVFPLDEGDKKTVFDWWYLSTHLVSEKGRKIDYTVVYISNDSNRMTRQTSITDETDKTYYGQLASGFYTSKEGQLNLSYTNLSKDRDRLFQKSARLFDYRLHTEISNQYCLTLDMSAQKPPLVNGPRGLIAMGNGGPSFYYSQTNIKVKGEFKHNQVNEPVHGIAWIDRQWGSWSERGYAGWEWFAIQLDDNTEIMLFLFFDLAGKRLNSVLNIMFEDGSSVRMFSLDDFLLTYLDFFELPNRHLKDRLRSCTQEYLSSGWKLHVPKSNIDLVITPVISNQMISRVHWEGSCKVEGTRNGKYVQGIATVELTHRHGTKSPFGWAGNLIKKVPSINKYVKMIGLID